MSRLRPYDVRGERVRHSWRVRARPRRRSRLRPAMPSVAVAPTPRSTCLRGDRAPRLHLVSLYVTSPAAPDRMFRIAHLRRFLLLPLFLSAAPSTSQPALGDFLAVYERWSRAATRSFELSAAASPHRPCRRQARELLIDRGWRPSRMVVIDSRTGCAGDGLMAVAARTDRARRGPRRRGGHRQGAAREPEDHRDGGHARVPSAGRRIGARGMDQRDPKSSRSSRSRARSSPGAGAHRPRLRAARRPPRHAARTARRLRDPAHPGARRSRAHGRARPRDVPARTRS